MYSVYLTAYDGRILGPIAEGLGWILEKIFEFLEWIKIPNIALAIVLFTIVIYLLLTPLTIKQQKFSKLSAKMNPEIQAIQAKYKGKKDQASMAAMNEETQAVYKKYGVSPSGSCVQLIIQMPILFALYRVIYNVPAYVESIYVQFQELAEPIIAQDKGNFIIKAAENFANKSGPEMNSVVSAVSQFSNNITKDLTNGLIDVLNKVSSSDMSTISQHYGLNEEIISSIEKANNLFGLSISNSPKFYVTEWWFHNGSIALAIGAILIPLLSAFTQWFNTKLMPQADTGNDDKANAMAASMKSMNIMMPIMSLVFVYGLPIGMGIYWIAGAIVRSIQQVFINKHIDKMDIDSIVAKNTEKLEKQIEKKSGVTGAALNSAARMSTRTITEKSHTQTTTSAEKEAAAKKAEEFYNKGYKPGSLAAKANMVRKYNEKNNK